jgi:hypothetical protein
MFEFFRDGGWGMYPTLIFGVGLVAAALIYSARPERRFVPLLISIGVMTVGSGILGFSMGVINTFRYAAKSVPPEQHSLVLQGFAESTNNVVFALIFVVMSALIASVGAGRIARGYAAITAPQ